MASIPAAFPDTGRHEKTRRFENSPQSKLKTAAFFLFIERSL